MDLSRVVDATEALPTGWFTLPVTGLIIGLVLCFAGLKLVKPIFAVAGLVAGGIGVFWVCGEFEINSGVPAWVAGGAIAGFLVGLLMFRVSVATACAAVLSIAVPAMSMAWGWQVIGPVEGAESLIVNDESAVAEEAAAQTASYPEWLRRAWVRYTMHTERWWAAVDDRGKLAIILATALVGVSGLALGFIAPQTAALIETALVGATLSVAGMRELLLTYGPESISEVILRPRVAAAAVGLITLVGALVQWISLRQSADK